MSELSDKQIINVNKEDLNPIKLAEVIVKIYYLKMRYGWCYITSNDLTHEQLTNLFGDV